MAGYAKHEAQDWAWENLTGEWTTLPTPFTHDDNIDEAAIRHNIQYIQSLGTHGAGATWGMGEFWSLTGEERRQVIEVVADEAGGKWPIAAHVTHTSLKEAISLATLAESTGYDLLIAAAPYMVTKTESQVVEFITELAERTSLGIMFYNSPQFGIVMSPQGLKRLCGIPNVVGVKEASFSQQISIETHLLIGKQAVISTPDEWIFPKAEELGFRQQVVFANTSDWRFDTPDANHYVQYVERATRGDLDLGFYEQNLKPIKLLSDKWWGATVQKFGGALPVSLVKYWGELMGLQVGHVRAPLRDLDDDEKAALERELRALRPKAGLSSETDSANPGQSHQQDALSRIYVTEAAPKNENGRNGSSKSKSQPSNIAPDSNTTGAGMMLMVSVQDMPEALEADRGGADIVDIKNLQEAMVGSGHPLLVEQVRARIPNEKHVSVTLGVVPNQAGTVAMAVYSAAKLNATSVKVGFVRSDYESAVEVLQESKRALEGSETKLIGSLFADNELYDGLDPLLMPRLATETYCDGWLIDTLTKDGRNLFDFIPEPKLREMVFEGKKAGMSTALSGHLRMSDIDELSRINPDIVGVRGAVCSSGDRGRAVAWESVAEFKRQIEARKSGDVDVRGQEIPGNGGWVVVDGRGKNCAGVIAALTRQTQEDRGSHVEAIMADALNIYDVITWAEEAGHRIITQRRDGDGTLRLMIEPFSGVTSS